MSSQESRTHRESRTHLNETEVLHVKKQFEMASGPQELRRLLDNCTAPQFEFEALSGEIETLKEGNDPAVACLVSSLKNQLEEDEKQHSFEICGIHIGLFVAYLGKGLFDFLQNSTGMIQFFQAPIFTSITGLSYNSDPNNVLLFVPNLIYQKFVQPCGKTLGMFVFNIAMVIVLQLLKDYQVDDENNQNEGQKQLLISIWVTKFWKVFEEGG